MKAQQPSYFWLPGMEGTPNVNRHGDFHIRIVHDDYSVRVVHTPHAIDFIFEPRDEYKIQKALVDRRGHPVNRATYPEESISEDNVAGVGCLNAEMLREKHEV